VQTSHEFKVAILCNKKANTAWTIPKNKPNIIIRDKEKETRLLMDTKFAGNRNVIKKEAERFLKYKEVTLEIRHMQSMETKVIPVITGTTGTILQSFRKYMKNINGKHHITELQKTATRSVAYMLA
jgi:hypothetical protein